MNFCHSREFFANLLEKSWGVGFSPVFVISSVGVTVIDCVIAVACMPSLFMPAVASIPALAGVHLVPDILPTFACVPCVAGVSAVAFIPAVAGVPALAGFPAVDYVLLASLPVLPDYAHSRLPLERVSACCARTARTESNFLSLYVGHSAVNQWVVFFSIFCIARWKSNF